MNIKNVKIVVFTPLDYAEKIRTALGSAGAGKIGDYSFCSFSVKGIGRFKGSEASKPFLGTAGEYTAVEEERVEVICPVDRWQEMVEIIKKVHPYQEPAIDVIPLLN